MGASVPHGALGLPAILVWLCLGVCAELVGILNGLTDSSELVVFGLLNIALGLWIFWCHGGARSTAAGVYGVTSAVTVGFAALWWAGAGQGAALAIPGAHVGYWLLLAMFAIFWRRTGREEPTEPQVHAELSVWWLAGGVLAAIAGLAYNALASGGQSQSVLIGVVHFPLAGLSLTIMALITTRSGSRGMWLRILISLLAVLTFVQAAFTGYGRLLIVGLLMLMVIALGARFGRKLKLAVIAATGPGIAILVRMREDFGLETTGQSFNGIGSVVNPLGTFGELVAAHERGATEWSYGTSFARSVFFWMPDRIWPDRPPGFGSRLTQILRPELSEVGHSMSALPFGEWYHAFGWVGLLVMVAVYGLLIRQIDKGLLAARGIQLSGWRAIVAYSVSLFAASGMLNLAWGDSFTFLARFYQQAFFAVAVLVLIVPFARRRTSLVRKHDGSSD